jgi:hypothetical protein
MRAKQKTRAELARRIVELEAQLPCNYASASENIKKAGKAHFMLSGVMVYLHALGGREIVPPFMVADGLSDETIAALKADIQRSYAQCTELNEKRVNRP